MQVGLQTRVGAPDPEARGGEQDRPSSGVRQGLSDQPFQPRRPEERETEPRRYGVAQGIKQEGVWLSPFFPVKK